MLIDAMLQGDAARAERAMHDHLLAQLAALKALRRLQAVEGGAQSDADAPPATAPATPTTAG
ncbi:hypothetical protein [Ideonella livida]|uniref:hypothetical protein n=1 Tax=Ideonella livida TaxID=2707176 RepID=UPI0028733631|nr:hypothetical protein [Ideonella livida]